MRARLGVLEDELAVGRADHSSRAANVLYDRFSKVKQSTRTRARPCKSELFMLGELAIQKKIRGSLRGQSFPAPALRPSRPAEQACA